MLQCLEKTKSPKNGRGNEGQKITFNAQRGADSHASPSQRQPANFSVEQGAKNCEQSSQALKFPTNEKKKSSRESKRAAQAHCAGGP